MPPKTAKAGIQSVQKSFPKIENLADDVKSLFLVKLSGASGVSSAAKYLHEQGLFPSPKAAYVYVNNYRKSLSSGGVASVANPGLGALSGATSAIVETAVSVTKQQMAQAAEIIAKSAKNRKAMDDVASYLALHEMVGLARLSRDRALSLLAEEQRVSLSPDGGSPRSYVPLAGVRESLESAFTMATKVAQLQIDLGHLVPHDPSKALKGSITEDQRAVIASYGEQVALADLTVEALGVLMGTVLPDAEAPEDSPLGEPSQVSGEVATPTQIPA